MSRGVLTPRTDALIDWVCPVNWLHPLNRGLAGWWLCVPGAMGGATWPDLCNRNHGVLTSLSAVTSWGGPRGRPGGLGSLDFAGASNLVTIPNISSTIFSAAFTLSVWAYHVGDATEVVFAKKTDVDHTAELLRRLTADTWEFRINLGTGADVVSASGAAIAAVWQHVAVTRDAANLTTLYVNGVKSGTAATVAKDGSTTAVVSGFSTWAGFGDDLRLSNACLAATEVKELYQLSRLGYPGMLRRVQRPAAVSVAAAPGGDLLLRLHTEGLYVGQVA